MPRKVQVLEIMAGGELAFRSMPVDDEGVAVDQKASESVMLLAPPARYRLGNRLVPWVRERPLVAHFAGDGEDISFAAGPENDWREPAEVVEVDDEGNPLTIEQVADARVFALNENVSRRVLLNAQKQHQQPGQSALSLLITMTTIAVAIVFVMALVVFVDNQGGLSQALPLGAR